MGNGFLVAAGLCVAVAISLAWLNLSLQLQRRIYWCCTLLASMFSFLSAYPNLQLGLGLVAFTFFAMTALAFRWTPYIRVNGRIYALRANDVNAEAENPSGPRKGNSRRLSLEEWLATARGVWWFVAAIWLVFDASIAGSLVHGGPVLNDGHDRIMFASILIFLFLFGVALGFIEAVNEYPLAQRQTLQFVIATISSAGLFAVLYLTSYYLTALTRGSSSGG
ncbi:hypothetical protein A5648_16205 [Mycolicibacter sinensis]|uniref:Transmembrane protein n=2 Tax=Mycolicibacter sinensis (strain JDM601) TaxID=875328 RepID=A0A1A3U785_MYCSD|nr:hypothetical protein A5648_16205 [Mycolicibacter sinensis]